MQQKSPDKRLIRVPFIPDAAHELRLAERFDPNDPTPAFFSALLNQQLNRFSTAIGDLEKALELNDNRMIYRSGFLLDQDRAVRRANLAAIYLNSGLQEISVREANRAVDDDYTNFSSHLFLANAFDAMRESRRINLRFETTAANQLLLANLLAPAGTGTLGQHVSLQEYTPLLSKRELVSTPRPPTSATAVANFTRWQLPMDLRPPPAMP